MPFVSSRALFLLAFIGCLLVMLGALYLEHVVGLEPCPLCVVQRICVILFGLVCLLAALQGPGLLGQRLYALLLLLLAAAGGGTAARQVYLQTVPADQLPACIPPLDYLMDALPFQEIVRVVLHGSADCAEVSWTLFTLSLPEWSLLAFAGMLLFGLVQLLRRA
ncbi:disulfide bond formation protein B [Pseudomonas sp. N040]|uniref:disulfide bond formation protein B n=1 Tax=Pseudomonas sp. N040 TaxID=2785325 RepID=UPI0018A2F202|nr:disulfide bond formation protein B [Pseudomonas sp. N040]MBF7730140.1 disulfide bond formation protein B [Pseudomonas sp. N040]MBW7013782.1 disulfide bond formation protein B [Pseudomonas sp. N040]